MLGSADDGPAWAMPTPYVLGRLPLGTPAPPVFIAYDPHERGDLDIEGYLADIPYVATGGGTRTTKFTTNGRSGWATIWWST